MQAAVAAAPSTRGRCSHSFPHRHLGSSGLGSGLSYDPEIGDLCWTGGRVFSPAETETHDHRDFGLRPSLVGHLPCGLVSADRAVRDHEDEAGGQDPAPRTVEQKDGAAREPGTPLSRRRTPASAVA